MDDDDGKVASFAIPGENKWIARAMTLKWEEIAKIPDIVFVARTLEISLAFCYRLVV